MLGSIIITIIKIMKIIKQKEKTLNMRIQSKRADEKKTSYCSSNKCTLIALQINRNILSSRLY